MEVKGRKKQKVVEVEGEIEGKKLYLDDRSRKKLLFNAC